MKIGIDTFGCDHGRSGQGLYLLSLISNLPQLDSVSYNLFGSNIDKYTYFSVADNLTYSEISVPDSSFAEYMWHLTRVNSFTMKQKYDVVFYSAGGRFLPTKFNVPGVAAINDVISMGEIKNKSLYKWHLKKGLNACTKIIAASQFIKKDLISLSINPEKIEVIHNGIDHSMFYPRKLLNPDFVDIKPFAIKRPYFLYASRIQGASKKHIELIRAFNKFKEKTKLPHRLVLAGGTGVWSETVDREVSVSPFASDIFQTGFFPHQSLPELYSYADACLFPSVTEGVGLPVLEAMACGVPVACAKAGALPEIAGNNALFFNPDNIEEVADILEKIIKDENLRKNLIDNGIEWTKRFSWEKTAQKTLDVLSSVVKK